METYKTTNKVLMQKKRFFILSHTTKSRRASMRLQFKKKQKPQKPGIISVRIEGFTTGYSVEAPGINFLKCLGNFLKDRSNRHCQLRPPQTFHHQELGMVTELLEVAAPLSPNDLLLATVTDHMLSPTHFLQPLLSHPSCTLINLLM